jgi:hypothetical protein
MLGIGANPGQQVRLTWYSTAMDRPALFIPSTQMAWLFDRMGSESGYWLSTVGAWLMQTKRCFSGTLGPKVDVRLLAISSRASDAPGDVASTPREY